MSSQLSMDSEESTQSSAQRELYVPFTAFVRVIPHLGTGKRADMVRNLQKAAKRAEQSLDYAIDNAMFTYPINIASPVAWTPQYGDATARLTIVGFAELHSVNDRPNQAPTTDIYLIHSGTDQGEPTATIRGNRGGSLAEAQDPIDAVVAEVNSLRVALAAALDSTTGTPGIAGFRLEDIVRIEYNGVKFGIKGRSFNS